MQAISEGRYDEGIGHLLRAHQILPHPNVLYNVGLAHMYAGRDEEALLYFERYKEAAPNSDSTDVDALIRELRPQVEPEPVVATPSPTATPEPTDEPQTAANPVPVPRKPPSQAAQAASQKQAQEGVYEERVTSASRLSQSPLDAPNATAIVTAQDIRLTGATTITQLLRRVAGVEVTQVTPYHSEVSIRGLNRRSANKVLLLLDGRPMRKDFLGTSWVDMLPIVVDDIERIEIIRGPASALYGADAFSGVINVITRAPGQEQGSFLVGRFGNQGNYQGAASFSGRSGKDVSYRATAGYINTDNYVRVVGPRRVDVQVPTGNDPVRSYDNVFSNGDVSWNYMKGGTASVGGNYTSGAFTLQGLSRLGQVVTAPGYEAQLYGLLTTPVGLRVSTTYDRVSGHP
ncbi:MAG TPA: TonB-dependent receptor plug domain-containing protein, partial [Polyangiales bacterium]